jgi:hypothetical protein
MCLDFFFLLTTIVSKKKKKKIFETQFIVEMKKKKNNMKDDRHDQFLFSLATTPNKTVSNALLLSLLLFLSVADYEKIVTLSFFLPLSFAQFYSLSCCQSTIHSQLFSSHPSVRLHIS